VKLRVAIYGALIAVLSACAPMQEDAVVLAEPVILEEAVVDAAPVARCGEDDGIGGTGCAVD